MNTYMKEGYSNCLVKMFVKMFVCFLAIWCGKKGPKHGNGPYPFIWNHFTLIIEICKNIRVLEYISEEEAGFSSNFQLHNFILASLSKMFLISSALKIKSQILQLGPHFGTYLVFAGVVQFLIIQGTFNPLWNFSLVFRWTLWSWFWDRFFFKFYLCT
jgi:hypothetical protein